MRISNCNRAYKPISRCHTPLIAICDTTTQIKLDLLSCGICATTPSALLLRKGGCTEWETVCDPPRTDCCGVVDARPVFYGAKRAVPKPKPSIIYPLLEVNPEGLSVFALDGKLKELGYGRYHGIILLADTLPTHRPPEEADYTPTDIRFDVDFTPYRLGLGTISVSYVQPAEGAC